MIIAKKWEIYWAVEGRRSEFLFTFKLDDSLPHPPQPAVFYGPGPVYAAVGQLNIKQMFGNNQCLAPTKGMM